MIESSKMNDAFSKSKNFHYNYLLGIAMLYMTFMILSGITVYKLVEFNFFVIPAGLLVTPFIYSLSNITTEVYGYEISRNMMWWFVFSSAAFTFFGFLLSHAPSPIDFKEQHAFSLILGGMPIVFIAGIIGTILGVSFNNYFVSKYKIILNGRKYWLRSILSTIGGEIVYNLVAYPMMWIGHVPFHVFLHILLSATVFKVAITGLVWPMECLFAAFLKAKEGIDVIDFGVKYNIFRFRLTHKPQRSQLKIVK